MDEISTGNFKEQLQERMIKMKVLITGANGQLGRALQKVLIEDELYLYDSHDMDITNFEKVEEIIGIKKPDVIINCAAHTKVDLCEVDVENAYRINAIGARNLAVASSKMNSKLVHISTDYVFEGNNPASLREDELVKPNTIYGKSKLMGEEFVKRLSKNHFIIRTAWLYGDGDNFVRTMLKLSKQHKKLKVVNDQIGTPTSTKDLANLINKLIRTEYYGTYHGTCHGKCSWYDFAVKIFEYMKVDIEVEPCTTDEFPRPAKRPEFSVLDNFMLRIQGLDVFRTWEDAIEDYLEGDREWQNSNL